MDNDYALRRKEYVESIKRSFGDSENGAAHDIEDENNTGVFVFFKVKLFIAIIIFAAFLLCKYTNYEFYGYQAKDIIDIISDNHYYTNLQDYVMIQEQDLSN